MRISEAREGGSTVRHPSVCSVHAATQRAARHPCAGPSLDLLPLHRLPLTCYSTAESQAT